VSRRKRLKRLRRRRSRENPQNVDKVIIYFSFSILSIDVLMYGYVHGDSSVYPLKSHSLLRDIVIVL
jgi:hypothetical protein